jgi:hypothetical protein
MTRKIIPSIVSVGIALICSFLAGAGSAHAGLYMTFELQETYCDNVIGLLADNRGGTAVAGAAPMNALATQTTLPGGIDNIRGQSASSRMIGPGGGPGTGGSGTAAADRGDFSTNLYANIGYDWELGSRTRTMLEGSVDHTRYNTFSDFDFTIVTAGAGISRSLTDRVLAQVMAWGSTKDYGNDLRDGTAYGAGLTFRERFSEQLWSRQTYEIEQNNADSPEFTHLRHSAGVVLGYDLSDDSTLSARYTYYLRDYNAAPPTVTVTSQIASVTWRTDISQSWNLLISYDHEWADSSIPDTATSSNTYSLGIRYDY